MNSPAPAGHSDLAIIRRVAREYLKPHWKGLAVSFLLAVVIAGLSAAFTFLLQRAIHALLEVREPGALWLYPSIIAGVGIARGLALAVQLRLINRIGHMVVGELQLDLFSRLIGADLIRLQAAHSGQHVSSMLFDANLVRDGSTNIAVNYVQQGLIALGMIIYMATTDPILTGIVLVGAPIAFMIIRKYSGRSRRAAQGAMGETSVLSTAILEGLDGVKIVKIEGREAYERERVKKVIERRQVFLVRGTNAKALAGPIVDALMVQVVAAVLIYAGWRALNGGMTASAFAVFLVALTQAAQSLRQLGGNQTVIAEATVAAGRLFQTLDIEPALKDRPDAMPLAAGPSTIKFDKVSFAYGDAAPALAGVSFEVARGETVALVGPSGGGKSTILNLIPRFYDVTAGAVLIDGQDVRSVTQRSIRDRIALVTQEPFLFDDTIRANIAYAKPNATGAEIAAAAAQAAAHDFIAALPKGYDTTVGEAGSRLSGGQRQRIAIARAFLKDAPILLLDEATSALDTESEAQVQIALERLMSGRTTIMIHHRLSTVRSADRIHVIEAGKIVETGTHSDLMRQGGLYQRLASAQHLDVLERAG